MQQSGLQEIRDFCNFVLFKCPECCETPTETDIPYRAERGLHYDSDRGGFVRTPLCIAGYAACSGLHT